MASAIAFASFTKDLSVHPLFSHASRSGLYRMSTMKISQLPCKTKVVGRVKGDSDRAENL